jgi:uncharacterized metal-binding protein YceD (DUF177 family)
MRNKEFREYDIQLLKLKNGEHEFEFEFSSTFFSMFPESLIEHGEGEALIKLVKRETMLEFSFDIRCEIKLICDVSLKEFKHPINLEKNLIVKLGDEDGDLGDDVMIIERNTPTFNVASFIYEYVTLEIPMKKVHPDLENEDRPDMIYEDDSGEDEEWTDPRWEALKNIKGIKK